MKKILDLMKRYSTPWAAIMAVCSVILYLAGYLICESLYPNYEDLENYKLLSESLSVFIYLLLIWTYALPKSPISVAAIYCFMVLAMGDVLDRWLFNTSSYQWNDTVAIIGALIGFIAAFIKTYKKNVPKP